MFLIVGLWNPWKEYALTRHNVGFLFLDVFTESHDVSDWKKWYQWLYCTVSIDDEQVIFLKPETYMNLSGKSVSACASFYKILPRDIIIISDDIDMDFWKIRYREAGSGGGHNWISSVIEHVGTKEIKRIKIGIGRHPNMDTADWVLSKFTKEEKEKLSEIFPEVEKKMLALITTEL